MIELVSVEVTNFRSFGFASFAPLGVGQGLTAINGSNGTGKSSIATHALVWALYGIAPDGVSVKALRRQDSEGEVRVTVVFRHDGQTVSVSRALRGRNDTTVAAISVDGVEQTNISSKTATAWVENRLGIDAEAFLTAFVIRQKEVDALVRARPSERRALVERLAGIDRMSAAVTRAREIARHASNAAAAFGPTADISALEQESVAADEHANALESEAEEAQATALESKNVSTAAARALEEATKNAEQLRAAQHSLDLAEQAREAAKAEHERIALAAEGADLLADFQAAAAEASEARLEAERKAELADTIRNSAAERERAAQEAADLAAQAQRRLDSKSAAVAELERKVSERPDLLDEQIALAEEKVAVFGGQLAALAAESARLGKALQALQESLEAGAAACPTCASPLADSSVLVAEMSADLEQVNLEHDKVSVQAQSARQKLADLRKLHGDYADAATALEAARAEQRSLAREAERARRESDSASEVAESAAEAAHDAVREADLAAEELPSLQAWEKQAQSALRRAENAVEAEAQLPDAAERLAQQEQKCEELRHVVQQARGSATSPDVMQQMKEDASRAQEASVAAVERAGVSRQEAALARREATAKAHQLEAARKQAEDRRRALAEVEKSSAVAAALEEFRRDRIARLAPELSEVASDIVSVMTEGKYATVELDEDFTPILTEAASGLQRPTSWLSGGEESAVALALRIAIGDVVSGQQGGLLVLDEVLTAQDPQRRAAVMSAVRSLATRQVITINHVSEATDMVDLVATVRATDEEGSVLEHSAAGGASGPGVVSDEILAS